MIGAKEVAVNKFFNFSYLGLVKYLPVCSWDKMVDFCSGGILVSAYIYTKLVDAIIMLLFYAFIFYFWVWFFKILIWQGKRVGQIIGYVEHTAKNLIHQCEGIIIFFSNLWLTNITSFLKYCCRNQISAVWIFRICSLDSPSGWDQKFDHNKRKMWIKVCCCMQTCDIYSWILLN